MDAHAAARGPRHDQIRQRHDARGCRPEAATLYNYEGNQFARLAREALCELELPYTLFNCGKGSPKRATLTEVAGECASVPYLVDPNTGQNVGESEEIVAYLFKTYGGAA